MTDFDRIEAIPEPLVTLVRSLLQGRRCDWPGGVPVADQRRFLLATSQHGIQPLLLRAASDALALWPQIVLEELRANVAAQAALEVLRGRDLAMILSALGEVGVEPLLMKGAALAYSHYESLELRPRSDTDLFIRDEDFSRVREAMLGIGYSTTYVAGRDLVFRQASFFRQESFGFVHAYDFHWRITNLHLLADALTYDECSREAVPVDAIGTDAMALGPKQALLLACVHRVAHHANSRRLIWLADIHRLAGRMTTEELQEFWSLAERKRLVGICRDGIRLAEEWFGLLPGMTVPREQAEEPSSVLLRSGLTRLGLLWIDLRAMRSWPQRARLLVQHAFPASETLAASGRSRALLPYLYARRFVRGFAGWIRRQ